MNVTVERRSVIRGNGDVDDFVTFVLRNEGAAARSIDGVWLEVLATDYITSVVSVSDGLVGKPAYQHGPLHGRYMVAVCCRGELASGSQRYIGVHLSRRECASVEPSIAIFGDPYLAENLATLHPTRENVHATVIFPADDFRRAITASGASVCTSRTVTWEFTPTPGVPRPLRARCEVTALPPSAHVLDDAIAELHTAIGGDAAGEAVAEDALREQLRRAFADWDIAPPDSLGRLSGLAEPCGTIRQRRLRHVLADVLRLRPHFQRALPALRLRDEPASVTRWALQQVADRLEESALPVPITAQFSEALLSLIQFAEVRRRLGSSGWSEKPKEQEFQEKLHDFLLSTQRDPEREVQTGEGRIDFLLFDTPVELKVDDWGTTPRRRASAYLQQAADYAANRGSAVGVLMLLNTADFSREERHQPHLLEDLRIDVVPARAGMVPTAGTVVVTVTITASPPRPSTLRG